MPESKIRLLSDVVINQIAAGEVIENPASVVKELVENSIDAGATAIHIDIQEGGRQMIRISDNGCGMNKDDALLSLERHATSKIRSAEDIQDISTMGFRGEALPSIASISKFTLLTCAEGSQGTLLNVDGGRITHCGQATRSLGTTIEVKALFFNVPVRRKFQKSPAVDELEISKIVGLMAMANPCVQFELISNQKVLLKTPHLLADLSFQAQIGKQIECVQGSSFFSSLVPLDFRQGEMRAVGYIGEPLQHRPNKTGQFLFINRRPITSPLIAGAIREGYGTMLPAQRYPVFVLHVELPGSLLDVNVHPQKKEVRLRQEAELKAMLSQAIQEAIFRSRGNLKPPSPFSFPVAEEVFIPAHYQKESKWTLTPSPLLTSAPKGVESRVARSEEFFTSPNTPPLSHPLPTPSLFSAASPRVIATVVGYILLEPYQLPHALFPHGIQEGGFAVVCQRAAHSRILYEKMIKKDEKEERQPLLIPLTFHLSTHEVKLIEEVGKELSEIGLDTRPIGEEAVIVEALPSFVPPAEALTFLRELLHNVEKKSTSRYKEERRERSLALAACRAALSKSKRLSIEEATQLVGALLNSSSPSLCPFGKPTCCYVAPDEIASWFCEK